MTETPKPAILVVEDDDDCRSVLQDLLEMAGYAVVSCSDAHHAVAMAIAARPTPALLLVDYLMPDANGGWVVEQLRKQGGALARMPVVLTTGSSAGHEIARGLGIRSLEKPFDVSRLLELVKALVQEGDA